MGQSASAIAQELEQTRERAGEKIEKIEQQVTETTEAVKQQLDWRQQVEARPLLALGVAFAGGLLLGGMSGGSDASNSRSSSRYDPSNDSAGPGTSQSQGGMSGTLRQAFQTSGAEAAMTAAAAAMVTTVGQRVKEVVDDAYPGFTERYTNSKQTDGSLLDKIKAPAADEATTESLPIAGV